MNRKVTAMRFEFVAPFIDAAITVLNDVLAVAVTKGRTSLKDGMAPAACLSVSFGLTGEVEGTVLFDIPEKTAFEIAGAMNCASFDAIEPAVLDTIAELMNMIVGRSVTLINDKGFRFNLTPPTIFSGREIKFYSAGIEALVVPVNTAYGEFAISVAMRATV